MTGRHAGEPHVLLLNRGEPAALKGGLTLHLLQQYEVVEATGERGPWKVSTRAYHYELDDEEGRELLAYHWHPRPPSPHTQPHLHLGAAAMIGHRAFTKAHLPTGRIALEDFLRLAIEDFGVVPLREDWSEVLGQSLGVFEEWRTWPGPRARPSN